MSNDLDISIVIPVLNEEESLNELYEWISRVMESHGFHYEIIFIDDGSTDNSWQKITDLGRQPEVKALKFSKNFGKSAALNAGFHHCTGKVIVTMDSDLQDDPEEIPDMYRMVTDEGYHLVSGWKKKRKDPISKTLPSKFFNATTRRFSGVKLHDFNCGLKVYRAEVVRQIELYGEMHRYIPMIAKWSGFDRIGEKVVNHHPRKYGTTKFGMERFIRGFLDLLSITFVSKFKKRPMHFFGTLGTLSFLGGLLITMWIIGEKLYYFWYLGQVPPRDVVEQPLFFLALVALVIGVQLFLAGFLSEMITQNSTKQGYLLTDKIGF